MQLVAENDFVVCCPSFKQSRTSNWINRGIAVGGRQRSPLRHRRQTTTSSTAATKLVRSYRETGRCRSRRQAAVVVAQFYARVLSVSAACIAVTSTNCKVTAATVRAIDGEWPDYRQRWAMVWAVYQLQRQRQVSFFNHQPFLLPCHRGCALHCRFVFSVS